MMMLMNRYPSWNSNIIATQWGAVISTDFEMVSTYALPQFQDMAKSKWIICSDLHRCVCSTGKHQGVGSWFDKIFRSGKHKAIPVPQHFQLMVLEFTCHMKYHAHIYIYMNVNLSRNIQVEGESSFQYTFRIYTSTFPRIAV